MYFRSSLHPGCHSNQNEIGTSPPFHSYYGSSMLVSLLLEHILKIVSTKRNIYYEKCMSKKKLMSQGNILGVLLGKMNWDGKPSPDKVLSQFISTILLILVKIFSCSNSILIGWLFSAFWILARGCSQFYKCFKSKQTFCKQRTSTTISPKFKPSIPSIF